MDGSMGNQTLLAGLENSVRGCSTFQEVRSRVRAWATQRGCLPCVTSATETAVIVAYHTNELGCQKVSIQVPADVSKQFFEAYEASKSGW
jgi:hypothetical protein